LLGDAFVKVLFLTSRLPFPPVGGDKLRTFNFVKYIGERHDLDLVSFIEDERELEDISSYRRYYRNLITVKLSKTRSYLNCLRGIASAEPLQVHYYSSRRMREVVAKELRNDYDVVFSHLIRMAQYLPKDGPPYRVIDFTDALSLYHNRSRYFRKGWTSLVNWIEAKRVMPYERESMRRADLSVFVSAPDADHLRAVNPHSRIEVVANGVDFDQFEFSPAGHDPNQIVFLGNMRTFPNTDAVLFFSREVFPLVKRRNSEARFVIVGNEPSKDVRGLHNGRDIVVTGYVDSVIPYLKGAAVLVAPMRACAGIQNKILEALAVGTPVVATSLCAEGFDRSVVRVADTPEAIAAATLHLMENGAERTALSIAGRKYVETHFSWERALEHLGALLNGVARSPSDPLRQGSARDSRRAENAVELS
jgi:sugar transferase (PEP-CTERM/EpsH1 system associated)